jgi:GNAT superfamily N-acetyltransferase
MPAPQRAGERSSEESLSPTAHLSARQLAYLTEVDHRDHEALVAIEPSSRDGLGVARYVRSRENPREAEFAVAVADDWQRRGLGTLESRLHGSAERPDERREARTRRRG